MAVYDGLTRNQWPGTWSPSSDHPIVLDTEIRGALRFVSGGAGDLNDIAIFEDLFYNPQMLRVIKFGAIISIQ
jgi:hypothetical protein